MWGACPLITRADGLDHDDRSGRTACDGVHSPMPAAASSPVSARELMLVGLGALVVGLCVFWPLPLMFTDGLVTAPTGEGADHLWRWWAVTEAGALRGAWVSLLDHPAGQWVHCVDPLHALLARLLGWPLAGPGGGLAVVQLLGVLVAAIAGHQLADVAGADRAGRVLAAAAAGSAPTLLGAGLDGITEGLGVGWVGLQLAFLIRLVRTPGWRPALGVAVCLSAAAWTGPYNAVFSALIDVPVALVALPRTRWPLLAGGLGGVGALPVLLSALGHGAERPGGVARSLAERPPVVEAWRGAWRGGADLLDLLLPVGLTGGAAEAATTGYLGLVLVVVGCIGLWRGWSRMSAALALGGVLFASLALGPFVVVAGEVMTVGSAELRPPAALLEQLPVLGRLSRWYRASAVAVLLWAPLAGLAVSGRRARWAFLLGGLIVVDARLGMPVKWPGPTIELPASADWQGLNGPIAELPAVHPLHASPHVADYNLLAQIVHQQPGLSTIDAWPGQRVSGGLPVIERALRQLPPDAAELVRSGTQQLHRAGFAHLVVYPSHLERPADAMALLRATLGPEAVHGVDAVSWPLGVARP